MPTTAYHTHQAYHPPGWGRCTTTHYLGGAVYESKAYSPVPAGYTNYSLRLQFAGHEEGRLRATRTLPQHHPTALVYDYMLKDHLGNVRMVLTEEQETIGYPALTFEGTAGSAEVNNQNSVWENANGQPINVTAVRTTAPGVLQNSGLQPPPGSNAMLVRSSTGKVGAGKLLKVMAGDKIHTSVQYYYPSVGTQPQGTGLNTLLAGLASVLANSAGAGGLLKTATTPLAQGLGADPLAAAFFTQQNTLSQANRPKAYLTVLFFDEQFKLDNNASRTQQVGTSFMNPNNPGQIGFMAGSAALAQKSGYCYIYISNESDDLVYFDNFTLSHEKSSLMEETHYYPFGLTMAGISSKASGKLENKFKYNGNELQNNEFSDGSGLDLFDFNARTYDQQIGRFIQQDPLAGKYFACTPYNFVDGNPLVRNDPTGEDWFQNRETGSIEWRNRAATQGEITYEKGGKTSWLNLGSELLVFNGESLTFYTQQQDKEGNLTLFEQNFDAVSGLPEETGGGLKSVENAPSFGTFNYKSSESLLFDYSESRQRRENIGPIPIGLYSIRKSAYEENSNEHGTQKWSDLSGLQKIASRFSRGQWGGGIGHHSFGDYRWRLKVENANTNGRGKFFLHGGGKWGNLGCIDVGNNVGTLANAILTNKSGNDKVYLQVVYQTDFKLRVANSNTNALNKQ